MVEHPLQAVLFDFDFTLADSSAGVILCANHALEAMGLPPAADDEIRRSIGLSLPAALELLTGIEDADAARTYRAKFLERAEHVVVEHTFIYEVVPQVVASLRAEGLRTAIVSTKHRIRISEILERAKLTECFDVIVGGEDVRQHKPDPAGLRIALERLGSPASGAFYVGDHLVDAEAAEQHAVPFIAVLTGTTSRQSFGSRTTHAIIDDLSMLPGAIGRGVTR